jgi:nucleoid DNA-binding protein
MNNKEFQTELAQRLGISQKRSAELISGYVDNLVQLLADADELPFLSMGNFEIKQKEQRIIVNPKTKKTMLVPPKLTLNFKPSTSLKNKYKTDLK